MGNKAAEPPYFVDLNLDQTCQAAFASRSEYALAPYFMRRLHDAEAVTVQAESKEEHVEDAFDLALASRLVATGERGGAPKHKPMPRSLPRWR